MPPSTRNPSDPPRRHLQLAAGPATYTDEGDGPLIVLVHGLPGSARDFRHLAPHLDGARIVRVELPGFGETPVATAPDATLDGRARFLLDVIAALELSASRPLLVGHSMGGPVATAAAVMAPETWRGLVLLSSPGVRVHRNLRRMPVRSAHALLSRPWLGPRLAPLLRRVFAAGGFRGYPDGELYRTIACLAHTSMPDHARNIGRLTLPVAVAWCDDDPLIEGDIAAELAAACPDGPRLRFDTGGHNPQKTHAAEIARMLLSWPAG